MKKLLSLAISALLLVGLLAGCNSGGGSSGGNAGGNTSGGNGGGGDTGAVETVVFYMVSFDAIPDSTTRIEDAINTYIAETYPGTNVALKLQIFGPADYNEKINLAMQSGTQMDVFIPLGIYNSIAQGQMLAIEDLLDEYGQGIKDILAQDFGSDPFATFTQNGHIYGVTVNKGFVLTPTLTWDADIAAAANVDMDSVESIWDLDPIFEAVKEAFPDIYPFSGTDMQDSAIMQILVGEQKVDGLGDTGNRAPILGAAIGDSSEVVNLYATQEFYDYMSLMRSWYEKGYLPSDMATSQTRATELWSADRLFCTWASYGGNSIATTISASSGKNIEGKWIAPFNFSSSAVSLAMGISSNTKVPEASMKFLNLLYTDEFVINTLLYGIEGEDYVKVDEHHWAYPEGKDGNSVAYTASLSTGVMGSESLQYQPVGVDWSDVELKTQQNKDAERSPFFGFVFDASPVVNEITALTNVYNQYYPGLACGSLDPDVAIPEFLTALEAAGIDNVIAEKQAQLDAWLDAQ